MFPGVGMGLDPKKMAEMQKVSRNISGVIRANYAEGSVNIKLSSSDPQATALIPALLEQFSQVLAQQLSAFFAITGEIIEVGKPGG